MKDFKEDCLDNISGMERTNKILFSLQNSIKNNIPILQQISLMNYILQ